MTRAETDRELLELAAKAAGIELRGWYEGAMHADAFGAMLTVFGTGPETWWNPLTDDGDALRLAVKMGITVTPNYHAEQASIGIIAFAEMEDSADCCTATRRAIVRAAAEIGRAAP